MLSVKQLKQALETLDEEWIIVFTPARNLQTQDRVIMLQAQDMDTNQRIVIYITKPAQKTADIHRKVFCPMPLVANE
jgi:hypothetical protein